jgi:hypothetical protein
VRTLVTLFVLSFAASCAAADGDYKAMSFDGFIDSLALGDDLKTDLGHRDDAHRVKNSPDAEHDSKAVRYAFSGWCEAHGGIINSNRIVDDKFAMPSPPRPVSGSMGSTGVGAGPGGLACTLGGKDLLGGYRIFSDRTIVFYSGR